MVTNGTPIDANHFPDEIFRKYVLDSIDYDKDAVLSEEEANSVTDIDLMIETSLSPDGSLASLQGMGISDVTGIEFFPKLYRLYCRGNSIIRLDAQANPDLDDLEVDYGVTVVRSSIVVQPDAEGIKLTPQNFPDMVFRDYVSRHFDENKDGALNEAEIAKVEEIHLVYNTMQNLKGVEYFTELKRLRCRNNELKSLDVRANLKLEELDCSYNSISRLDISAHTALEVLEVNGNEISSLDVSQCPKLWRLDCMENHLTRLDVSQNPELLQLAVAQNPMSLLDVTNNTKLEWLVLGDVDAIGYGENVTVQKYD
ncbi:MAG: hypothetical protein IKS10_06910 [Lachnospiraceae bacterium]|nr:hypothetical protein [Lachnospiraceae bacterium]